MIGYYVHHHGRGHLERAASVARALDAPVVGLSSLPSPGAPFADWIELPRDDRDEHAREHAAGGALHWAPVDAPGYSQRMSRVAGWLATARPRLVVVDVSVEITVLCRTLGVPTVVVAGAGTRADAPHTLAYRLATRVIAPWPREIYEPDQLVAHRDKCVYVGAFSRFDGTPAGPLPRRRRVVVLFGTGGSVPGADQVAAAAAATPDWTWSAHGLPGTSWCADVWAALEAADVVVTHAGQNALAEIAASRRPAIVVPQPRPFGEQEATARALAAHGIATVRSGWPRARDWPDLLAAARALGGDGWSRWNPGDGARRAAEAIAGSHA